VERTGYAQIERAPRRTRPRRWPLGGSIGLALLLAPLLLTLLGPALIDVSPTALHPGASLHGPSRAHPFGTDLLGRDQLARVAAGGRTALWLTVAVLALTVSIGLVVGSLAGYARGAVDLLASTAITIVLTVPELTLTLALLAVVGPGEAGLLLAFTATGWAGYARLVRGAVLSTAQRPFVEAARAAGARHVRVVTRHILPNIVRPLLALASAQGAGVMLGLAGLSFLGLGVQPPTADWGTMISDARPYLRSAPHLVVAPAACVVAVALGATLLADALLDSGDHTVRTTASR
jgi:peptide/nickel transport system permease protein